MDDLASMVETDDISVHNFRPNFVIETFDGVPFAEDKWDKIKIGTAEFYYATPCTRCLLTTVDPVRGEKSRSVEPLKTLRG